MKKYLSSVAVAGLVAAMFSASPVLAQSSGTTSPSGAGNPTHSTQAQDSMTKAKEGASSAASDAKDSATQAAESAKDSANRAATEAKDAASRAKESAAQAASETKDGATKAGDRAVGTTTTGTSSMSSDSTVGSGKSALSPATGASASASEGLSAQSIIGQNVKGADGDSIGTVSDLIVDPSSGTVTHAVIASGGFLGIGEKTVAVPLSELRIVPGQDIQANTISQSHIQDMPEYEPTKFTNS